VKTMDFNAIHRFAFHEVDKEHPLLQACDAQFVVGRCNVTYLCVRVPATAVDFDEGIVDAINTWR